MVTLFGHRRLNHHTLCALSAERVQGGHLSARRPASGHIECKSQFALRPNHFVQATPVYAFLFFLSVGPGAPDDDRSPTTRAERAELKSCCKDDKITAQCKRGTSAALGMRHQMIRSLFSNRVWRAPGAPNPIGKKRDWVLGGVYPGRRPRRPCPGLLSCRPCRGSRLRRATTRLTGGHMSDERFRGFGIV